MMQPALEVNEVLQYNVKKTRRNKRVLFQRKAEQEAINNQCERVSQESTNRDFSFNILMCYWPILISFVKYGVYSQLTLVQYLKIVWYSGWINQGLCSTLCWMKTIFLASRSFVTITENLMSCSLLVDYGVINFTLPAAHWRRKPRPPFPTTSTNNR